MQLDPPWSGWRISEALLANMAALPLTIGAHETRFLLALIAHQLTISAESLQTAV
jgi:hypothetical protein